LLKLTVKSPKTTKPILEAAALNSRRSSNIVWIVLDMMTSLRKSGPTFSH
jgi:hypothetical protein